MENEIRRGKEIVILYKGEVLPFRSFQIKWCDYISQHLVIEVDFYVRNDENLKMRHTNDEALSTTQGFYIEKYIDNTIYVKEVIK